MLNLFRLNLSLAATQWEVCLNVYFFSEYILLFVFYSERSFFVVRSDGSVNLNLASNSRARRAEQLITNAVAVNNLPFVNSCCS